MRPIYLTVTLLFWAGVALAQTSSSSLSKSLGLFVFPGKNQDAKTQEQDETACYKWAVEQTGTDPINPQKVTAEKVDTSPDGTAVVGAARGAAAGVAIGAIAGDTGKGAAIGSVVGALAGRRAKVAGDAHQQQANNQAAKAKEKELIDEFKKAFSACMEAKGYTVK